MKSWKVGVITYQCKQHVTAVTITEQPRNLHFVIVLHVELNPVSRDIFFKYS